MGRYLLPCILLFLKINFVFNYIHTCEWYVQICHVGGQRVPGTLSLQLEALVNHLVLVVGLEPGQSPF